MKIYDFYKGNTNDFFTKVNAKGFFLQREIQRNFLTKGNTQGDFYKGKYKGFLQYRKPFQKKMKF